MQWLFSTGMPSAHVVGKRGKVMLLDAIFDLRKYIQSNKYYIMKEKPVQDASKFCSVVSNIFYRIDDYILNNSMSG